MLLDTNQTHSTRLAALDGLRGYAVLLVFMVHFWGAYATSIGVNVDTATFSGGDWLTRIMMYLSRSHYGVDIFFVLSGLLIGMALQRPDLRIRDFLLHRVARIYPAFLLATILALGMWALVFARPISLDVILKNIFFLNGILFLQIPAINGVTWSLFYEACFYVGIAAFAFCFGRNALRNPILIFTIGLFVSVGLMGLYADRPAGLSLGLFFHLFCGATLASSARIRDQLARTPTWLVLTVWFTYTTLFSLNIIGYRYWFYYPIAALAATLLVAKTYSGLGIIADVLRWRPVVALGRVSYSFYLLHALVIAVFFHALRASNEMPNALLALGVMLALSVAAAWVSFMLTERPYFAHFRRPRTRSGAENS
jgi:exopolysaccharide production protein ExoZ